MGNKALIVLDNQPGRCADCTLTDSLASNMCVICYRHISNSEYEQKKPDWCPIISLPDKKGKDCVTILAESYRDGWNDCIDRIIQNSSRNTDEEDRNG